MLITHAPTTRPYLPCDDDEDNYEEEQEVPDPEEYMDEIDDEGLTPKIIKQKPTESDNADSVAVVDGVPDSVVVVDGVPVVAGERVKEPKNTIRKTYSNFGKLLDEHYPVTPDSAIRSHTSLDLASHANVVEAAKSNNNYKPDKIHTLTVDLLFNPGKQENIPDEWKAPLPKPYKIDTPLVNFHTPGIALQVETDSNQTPKFPCVKVQFIKSPPYKEYLVPTSPSSVDITGIPIATITNDQSSKNAHESNDKKRGNNKPGAWVRVIYENHIVRLGAATEPAGGPIHRVPEEGRLYDRVPAGRLYDMSTSHNLSRNLLQAGKVWTEPHLLEVYRIDNLHRVNCDDMASEIMTTTTDMAVLSSGLMEVCLQGQAKHTWCRSTRSQTRLATVSPARIAQLADRRQACAREAESNMVNSMAPFAWTTNMLNTVFGFPARKDCFETRMFIQKKTSDQCYAVFCVVKCDGIRMFANLQKQPLFVITTTLRSFCSVWRVVTRPGSWFDTGGTVVVL